jgi:hypothetical protein
MDVVKDFFRIQAFVFRLEVGSALVILQQVAQSMDTFAITQLEFSWRKKLCEVLEGLLGD